MQTPPPPPPPWQPPHHADPMSILGDMVGVPDVATPGISGAQRIWQGSLYLRGHRSDMHLPVVAVRLHTTERPPIQSVAGWPSVLQCDSSRLKPYHSVFPFMLDSATQWFVAFSVIDETGMEVVDDRFVQLVRVLVEQQLAFEIECETHGTLYLWGVNNIQHGTSLLAVFRPSLTTAPTQQTTLDNMRAQICDPPRTSIPASIPTAAGSSAMGYLHSTPPPPVTPAEFAEGQCIWRGDLHVRGHRNNMIVPCVARRYTTPRKLPIYDATGWPTSILCDSSKMIQCVNVFQYVNEPTSLWYARFLPLDENGNEVPNHQKLHALVKVVVERQLAFEIECNEGTFGHGTLYLWGMPVQGLGFSLLGVFRPKQEP